MDINSTWPTIETAYPFKAFMSVAVCSLFNNGRWKELKRCASLTAKYHNPENFVYQHLPAREKIENPYKNNRLEENNGMRKGILIDTLTNVDTVEIVKVGGVILEVFVGFFCHNVE